LEASHSSPPPSPVVSYLTTTASELVHRCRRLLQQRPPPSSLSFRPHFTTAIKLPISFAFTATRSKREVREHKREE